MGLRVCMVCDAAETLAGIAAGRNGLPKRTTAMLLAASLGPMVRGASPCASNMATALARPPLKSVRLI